MKYFLFDIGNVLTDFDFPALLQAYADSSGRPVEPQTDQDEFMYDRVEKGLLSEKEYVEYLNEAKGMSWAVEDLSKTWQSIFSINETGRELFDKAIDAGIAVYTLSNIAQYHVDAIEKNWKGFFDGTSGLFMSYKMGVRKPDSNIYRMVLEHLDAEGEQCFFIDDMPENVAAARAAGIHAYLFVPENHEEIKNAAADFFDFPKDDSGKV